MRLTRGESDEVVLHLYVHNGLTVGDGATPPSRPAAEPAVAAERPKFSGRLFGWEDHYHPIAKRMAPLFSGDRSRGRWALTRLGRFGFLAVLLTALMAVGCDWW